ncbi:WxL domain-containing protein [Vagococcus salmoninarum]|uniref:WxL domain-containing protein n=1 Tax=Vagococcus salmoninarum TaxID=2739 RepID=A0A429ZHL1_9ENTE|nr:WxL domain-containing protein [Vagococcus salmoninarum]RST93202.1 hypothetical protein CBF35_12070 [Vagococcus salmoninarum]
MMKFKKQLGLSALSLLLVSSVTVMATPREEGVAGDSTYTSKSIVTFRAADPEEGGIVPPVDPINPEDPVTPIDPTNPGKPVAPGTAGPLSLDYASSFSFGDQIISATDEIYYAAPQMVIDEKGNQIPKPSYVQVTDVRGTEAGWSLEVAQLDQFKAGEREIAGAELTFNLGQIATNSVSKKPSHVTTSLTLPVNGEHTMLMAATQGEGAGTWVYRMGDEGTMAKGVELKVPGRAVKLKEKKYEATLVWTLSAIPGV